jgi:hypothetical protein
VKFDNLYQDPNSDSDAPYADTLVLDAGGMDVKYGGETVAHVSFEDVDPFEIAFHAIPDDWEPHKEYEYNATDDTLELFDLTTAELLENTVNRTLIELGVARGWQRA